MAKGRGRLKGRPVTIADLSGQGVMNSSPVITLVAESSSAGAARPNGTVTMAAIKQQVELEMQNLELKQKEDVIEEVAKEAEASKIEEGEIPPARKRGMALGYVAPTLKKGIPTAQLCVNELAKEVEKWMNSIILYVIGNSLTIAYLKNYLQNQCGVVGRFEIFYHNEGYFVVRFEKGADKDRMLYEGPFMMASRPIIIKERVANFCFKEEVLKEIPLRVRLSKLPLHFWGGDSLSMIDNVLGNPVCADECTSKQQRISYARMLIEVDITKPLV